MRLRDSHSCRKTLQLRPTHLHDIPGSISDPFFRVPDDYALVMRPTGVLRLALKNLVMVRNLFLFTFVSSPRVSNIFSGLAGLFLMTLLENVLHHHLFLQLI